MHEDQSSRSSAAVFSSFLLLLTIAAGSVLYGLLTEGLASSSTNPSTLSKIEFSGRKFEASGVTHVRGTNGVLFVDDNSNEEIFWMDLDERRRQAGAITSVKLGAMVVDLEGITFDSSHFYVVGSQSKPKGGDLTGLVRFQFDPVNRRTTHVEAVGNLKRFLAENVAELRGMANRSYEDGGINVEGLAWDPRGRRLLLGLRSPVVDGHALLVPIRQRDSRGAFSYENLEVQGARAIRLPLQGAGIRSLEYDERRKAFWVITGAGPDRESLDFKVWEWNGDSANATLQELRTFDRSLKPEGITRVARSADDFAFIVFDTSGYTAVD